jgi:hypothetical protein
VQIEEITLAGSIGESAHPWEQVNKHVDIGTVTFAICACELESHFKINRTTTEDKKYAMVAMTVEKSANVSVVILNFLIF